MVRNVVTLYSQGFFLIFIDLFVELVDKDIHIRKMIQSNRIGIPTKLADKKKFSYHKIVANACIR